MANCRDEETIEGANGVRNGRNNENNQGDTVDDNFENNRDFARVVDRRGEQ